jgi:hypothetical protein
MQDRPSTEKTRFQGAVEHRPRQSLLADRGQGLLQRLHLGMGQRRALRFDTVAPLPHNDAIDDDDGPHGHLVGGGRFGSKF